MNRDTLVEKITANWPFEPNIQQLEAIRSMATFLYRDGGKQVFILKGYAGTGKTTLISSLVRTLRQHGGKVLLMAPTGRAAKVFSQYSGLPAYTIHKQIYRQKSITDNMVFTLDRNDYKNTLFFIDEASMISNDAQNSGFGSGRLLDDLIEYIYGGEGCAMVLVGDAAQLPPVGCVESPALDKNNLSGYGLNVTEFNLTMVMRQTDGSGILTNATNVRNMLPERPSFGALFPEYQFQLKGFSDIVRIQGGEFVEKITECYSRDGIEETVVLCRSNKRAIMYNGGIRSTILGREEELTAGDLLMVVKNNYYWTERILDNDDRYDDYSLNIPPFIANGDVAVVRRIRRGNEMYGFRFTNATLTFPDYDDFEMDVKLLLDTLHSEAPALTNEQSNMLFQNALADYDHIKNKRENMKLLRGNKYYNAIQVKYAYAVTCHKAQGGQWKNVFIDQGFIAPESRTADYLRWLYTALTRGTERVFLI